VQVGNEDNWQFPPYLPVFRVGDITSRKLARLEKMVALLQKVPDARTAAALGGYDFTFDHSGRWVSS
jgi:hypothetical protein